MASRNDPARVLLVLVAAVGLILAGCSSSHSAAPPTSASVPVGPPSGPTPTSGGLPWVRPADQMAAAQAAGLVPETAERLAYHVHAHLDVYLDGVPQVVPAGIGINIDDPGVHRFGTGAQAAYGGISPPCDQPCISPLHTHDVTGILHTESATTKDNTLGQFFVEWGVRLDAQCVGGYCSPAWSVAIYVNGSRFSGDPTSVTLSNRKEIAIVIGRPPPKIPDVFPA